MQYLTPQNGNAVSFLQDIGNFNQRYGVFYNNVGNALEDVIEMIESSPEAASMEYMKQIAIIVQAQYAFYVSEINGSLAYSQAFRARYENLLTPEYDTQESIYEALFQLLDEANASITAGTIPGDIMYNGDMTKWKKLGNTIHMLMALRLSNRNTNDYAKNEFVKALNAGIMTSNADNFVFKHLADANNQNYWYGQVVNQNREW